MWCGLVNVFGEDEAASVLWFSMAATKTCHST